MSFWKQLRIPLLIFTFASTLLVFGKLTLDPTSGKRKVTPFVFPQLVPLPQWQLIASQPLKERVVERQQLPESVLPGRHYRYIQNGLHLDINVYYEVETTGDVKNLIENHTAIEFSLNQPSIILRKQQQIGSYGLFADQKRAYLDACINSRGGSTFSASQFNKNRIRYDIHFNRIVLWLLGQQSLRDRRCLWTHLSIPLNLSSPESAYALLEKAWFSWYQWWRPRFPKQ